MEVAVGICVAQAVQELLSSDSEPEEDVKEAGGGRHFSIEQYRCDLAEK